MNNEIELVISNSIKVNGRQFTKVYGGFGKDNPIMTDIQVAELLGYKKGVRQVRETFERNKEHFEKDIDYKDILKDVAENDNNLKMLKTLGYSSMAVGKAKNIYIFSEAGFLLFLKFTEGEKAVEVYKQFREDYFRVKAELKSAEQTLLESKRAIIEERKFILGSVIFETDTQRKLELMERDKKLQDDIINIEKELEKQKIMKELEGKLAIADKFTSKNGLYDIGKFSKVLDIKGLGRNNMFDWMRNNKLLMSNNDPYQNHTEHFKIIYTTAKNGQEYTKTLLKGNGIPYIVKKLIKDGKLKIEYAEAMDKLNNELKPEKEAI